MKTIKLFSVDKIACKCSCLHYAEHLFWILFYIIKLLEIQPSPQMTPCVYGHTGGHLGCPWTYMGVIWVVLDPQ